MSQFKLIFRKIFQTFGANYTEPLNLAQIFILVDFKQHNDESFFPACKGLLGWSEDAPSPTSILHTHTHTLASPCRTLSRRRIQFQPDHQRECSGIVWGVLWGMGWRRGNCKPVRVLGSSSGERINNWAGGKRDGQGELIQRQLRSWSRTSVLEQGTEE